MFVATDKAYRFKRIGKIILKRRIRSMSTITNTREYRASVIIYKEDLVDLIQMQDEMYKVIKNNEESSALVTIFSAASIAAKNVLKWNLATGAAVLVNKLIEFVENLGEQEKEMLENVVFEGKNIFYTASDYFEAHPTFEAIQVKLSFLEATTDTVWRAAICDGEMENINKFTTEKILVNGIWLEP